MNEKHRKKLLLLYLFPKNAVRYNGISQYNILEDDHSEENLYWRTENEVLARLFAGEPIASVSQDTGIAKSTLYTWSKYNGKQKNKALNMTDYRILKQRCETLEKMVEILQHSPCAVSAPLHDRYQVIKDLSDHYSVNLLCQTLKVAKGSYYNHILRNANENTSYMRKRKELTPIIEQIFHETNQVRSSIEKLRKNSRKSCSFNTF